MSPSVFACGDTPPISVDSTSITMIEGLCTDPTLLREHEIESQRAVVILHQKASNAPDLQKALRSHDVDPLGVQVLEVDLDDDAFDLPLAIEGLSARAGAFAGSLPEHAKPTIPEAITRRGFLRPPAPVYVAVPRIERNACAAGEGCHACVDECPRDAYEWTSGRVVFNKDACDPCGRCLTACPTGAIENPAATPTMIDAQVRALIDSSANPLGIRFVCSGGSVQSGQGWADVAVPCTAMVPGSWLLACRLLGANGAYAVPCSESGCTLNDGSSALDANDLAQVVLAEAGADEMLVAGSESGVDLQSESANLFGRGGTPATMAALSNLIDADLALDHDAADLGNVTIDPMACTLCGQCAKICPTGSLAVTYEGETVSLTFDATACTNCHQCVGNCPEVKRGAISVHGRLDTRKLRAGRQTLNQGGVATCGVCGAVIAPAKMMDRIGNLLGDEFKDTMDVLGDRCIDCRGRV